MGKLRTLQELFDRGQAVKVTVPGKDALYFWVSKPNTFERQQATQDGRLRRGRAVVTFDRDEDQQLAVQAMLDDATDDALVSSLIADRDMEFWRKADEELRADTDWTERLDALRSMSLSGENLDDVERRAMTDLESEVERELNVIHGRLQREATTDLRGEGRERLEGEFRKMWRNRLGANSFREGRRQTEIFYALRECTPAVAEDGTLEHEGHCDHSKRYLDDREDVFSLPDPVVVEVVTALDDLQMTEAEAGNSDAPTVSSKP